MWKQIMSEIAYLQAVTLFVGMAIGITVAFGAMRRRLESMKGALREIKQCLEENEDPDKAAIEICCKALGEEEGK